jgi:transcriptional regulator of arginine metabolism
MKARRQAKILELIRTQVVETQEELAEALSREGIPVTQATISRDIKELQLTKVPTGDGRYRYAIPDEQAGGASWDKRRRIFRESVLGIEHSGNIIVVRALQGTAASVAYALDHLAWPEVLGTIAGEDTVFVVCKPQEAAAEVCDRVRSLMR